VLRDALEGVDHDCAALFTNHVITLDSAGSASADQIASVDKDCEAAIARSLDEIERLVRRAPWDS
jgi:hypothetical protein